MSRVVLCRCKSRKLVQFPENIDDDLKAFDEVVYIDDLCSSVLENPEKLREICDSETVVLACHKRAVNALLDYAKAGKVKEVFDFRSGDISAFNSYLNALPKGEFSSTEIRESSNAWYPCVDYDLCVNCLKCMDFCVFGVYAKVDGKLKVVAPNNCKDNCPACARVCPKSAVIFPKCPDLKISGKQEEEVPAEDFYDLLKKRKRRNVLK
ncbi:MAG: ferredoxin family protein [Opitutales bacterium]